jgi:hypothetical protein
VDLSHNQRVSKDYERLYSAGEALIHAAMARRQGGSHVPKIFRQSLYEVG